MRVVRRSSSSDQCLLQEKPPGDWWLLLIQGLVWGVAISVLRTGYDQGSDTALAQACMGPKASTGGKQKQDTTNKDFYGLGIVSFRQVVLLQSQALEK